MNWRTLSGLLPGFGAAFKETIAKPGTWTMRLAGFGECLPVKENRMELDKKAEDRFGIPQVRFNFAYGPNERAIKRDIVREASAMLKAAGAVQIMDFNEDTPGGLAIHEMGTARMGRDPKTSILNGFNQAHEVKNPFVTDGACMPSSSCVNPSITFMALTARAVDYAVKQIQVGGI